MNRDIYFDGPSYLLKEDPLTTETTPHPAAKKAQRLHQIGSELRRLVENPKFRLSYPAPNKPFKELSPRDQGVIIFRLLSAKVLMLELDKTNPPIATLVRDFQTLVTLIPRDSIPLLTASPETQRNTLKNAYDLWADGNLSDDKLGEVAKTLTGKVFSENVGPEVKAFLAQHADDTPAAPKWVLYGSGSESKAYQDGTGFVYKVAPINAAMLDIMPITNDGPLYPRIGAHLFANALGQIPILERCLAASTFPGLAPIEIVALTESGDVVFKQVDFGNDEPTTAELRDWALQHGHVPLPSQGEDPMKEFDNDTSVLPVVVKSENGAHLILDLNPRNCRRVRDSNGKVTIVPFDVISRPLLPKEIEIHTQIREAVKNGGGGYGLNFEKISRELSEQKGNHRLVKPESTDSAEYKALLHADKSGDPSASEALATLNVLRSAQPPSWENPEPDI